MSSWLKRFLIGVAVLPALAMATGTTPSFPAYQWHTFLGGDVNTEANLPASVVDAAGNLYITGHTVHLWDQSGTPQAASETGYRGYLTKISPTGQLLWSRFYSAAAGDIDPVAITLDSAGNIYIAGAYWLGLGNAGSSFVMETDPYGNIIWGTNFGGYNYLNTTVLGLTYDPATNWVYATGWAYANWFTGTPLNSLPTNGAFATFIAQVGNATQGEAIGWVGFYYTPPGNAGGTMGRSIAVDADSNLYVAGADGDRATVWKVSGKGPTAGQQIWEHTYGSSPSYSYGVAVDGSNVYVSGYSAVGWNGPNGQPPQNAFVGLGGAVAFVLKLDTDGNYAWHTFYPGNDVQSIGAGIALDGHNKVYVAGPGDIAGHNGAPPQHDTGGGGHFILQLDDLGNYQWHSLYGTLQPDTASSIAVDPLHNIFVSGTTGWVTWNGDGNTLPLHPASGYASEIFVMKFGTAAKTTPVITWSNPAGIVYGAALTATQLNANASVPGTFVYTPPAGTVLTAGANQTLSTTFTPTDTTDYTTAIKNVLINVSKATPVITWPAPAAITYGGALGNGQLCAYASVAGTFVYTPPAGTVLPVGKGQTLSVAFTPSDAVDYTTAPGSATIDVNAAPPPPSGVNLVITKVLTRTGGNVVVQLTIANTGGSPANNVTLTSVKVGTVSATPLPQNVGTIGANASAQATVSVPGSVGASGVASSLTATGTYTGGTFSLSMRITLP